LDDHGNLRDCVVPMTGRVRGSRVARAGAGVLQDDWPNSNVVRPRRGKLVSRHGGAPRCRDASRARVM
jgi:hypothetical protein